MLLQLSGIGVDLKAAFFHKPPDFFSCFVADIWMIIQHSGNRRHTVTGFLGQILDGHWDTSFFMGYTNISPSLRRQQHP